ncbi:MAG TPA: DnaA/Hda family protein [Geobacteraceae bacterium]|nr:DnaA/Hda family protein [Geobacteraceae bacterium]
MQLVFEFPINPKFTFENFVVCGGNRTAFQFARLVLEEAGDSLLYVYGPPGSGKTHLLMAMGDCLVNRGIEVQNACSGTIPCLSCGNIDEIYKGEYPAESVSKLAEKFRDAPALLIDDIHLVPDNENVKVEIWQVFNDFYNAGKKIVVTGLHPPRELSNLDGHLTSRLLWGLVAKMDVSDDDSRRMILKKLSGDLQVIVPDDVAEYLLLHVRRDLPSLIEALESISRFALSSGRKITVRLAREAIKPV